MELRPYQLKAVEWLCEHKRGLVVAPAGSGKTIIAAAAVSKVLDVDPFARVRSIGWVANTKEQVDQAKAAWRTCVGEKTLFFHPHCAAAESRWDDCDCLIVDEAHHATAPEWRKQIESCKGVRWGFTATPWGRDRKRNEQLKAMFGGNVFVIDREEVGQNLAPARVVWLDAADEGLAERIDAAVEKELNRRLRFRRYQMMPIQQARGEVAWQVCADLGIRCNLARNVKAVEAAQMHDEPTLILCGMVDHAQAMADAVGGVACWADMGAAKRREAIEGFKRGDVRRLVATTLADEGFDAPIASVLILLSGGRNEARTIQRTGRVLRPHPGKTVATIYDFRDTFHPLMARHAEKREQIYEKLGYLTGGV